MYKFKKIAGLILDQQDDPGAGWDILSQFWPENLEEPTYGQDFAKNACAIAMTDGHTKLARYPVDTPSNALASSMYFLAFGVDAIENGEDIVKIAKDLQEYRIAHNVHLPQDFVEFLKSAEDDEVVEVFADHEERLPVTTPEQTAASISLFTKKASLWPASERMLYSSKLQKAAEYHRIDATLPHTSTSLSKHASGAIDIRLMLLDQVTGGIDGAEYDEYIEGMNHIKMAMLDVDSYEDILKIAHEIETLDKDFGMDTAWDVQIPNPVDSVLDGFNTSPFPDLEKAAEVDWGAVNWDELPFEPDYIDAIKSDPEVIVPTLPNAQRKIVEDHIYGKI